MIVKLLNHRFDEKTSQLFNRIVIKFTAGRMNVDDLADPNLGERVTKQADLFKLCSTVDMIG